MTKSISLLVYFAVSATAVQQLTLGPWFWYTDNTCASWNKLMGRNYPTFEAETSIPYNVTADGTGVYLDPPAGYTDPNFMKDIRNWNDGTNASAFMTVYADQQLANGTNGLDLVSDEAIIHLAQRLGAMVNETGRALYIRWLPEMNGSWMLYGLQPTYYVSVWKRMYPIMKQYIPTVQLVWAPNYDLQPNDTSYWPGPDYVDVVGTSVYYKGFGTNGPMPASYIAESMSPVYPEYSTAYNKP
ncbi:hypothetical protein HK100_009403, partial [Physocladia obscura]